MSEKTTRRVLPIPDVMWEQVQAYRAAEMIATEAEAVRRLILAGLRAEARKGEKG